MKKKVLITGANKSLGFETARQLLAKDYFVYIGCRNAERGNEAVAKLKEEGFEAVDVLEIDVADISSVHNAAKTLAEKTEVLDVLINNAGIPGEQPQNASDTTQENIRKVFDTNFFGAIQTTQAFLPMLKKSAEPRIVNVSSGLGSLGYHSDPTNFHYPIKLLAYNSSKTALNAFTVTLAYEFKDTNFKINSVDPGYTKTDFNNHSGYKTIPEGAAPIVKMATLDNDGPTGGYFGEEGVIPW